MRAWLKDRYLSRATPIRLQSEAVSDVTSSPEVSNSDQSLGFTQNRKRKCRISATPARRSASPRLASSKNTGARRDGVAKMVATTIAFSVAMRVPDTQRATPHTVRGGTSYWDDLSSSSRGKMGSAPEDSSQAGSEMFRIMVGQQSHKQNLRERERNEWSDESLMLFHLSVKQLVIDQKLWFEAMELL